MKNAERLEKAIQIYKANYAQELNSCDKWIKWCEEQKDTHGMNFHQGMRSALVFNNIETEMFSDNSNNAYETHHNNRECVFQITNRQ